MLDPNDPLLARIKTPEGTRPPAAAIPPPGIYWLKYTACGSYWVDKTGARLDRPTHNEIWTIHTWDPAMTSAWFVAEVMDEHGRYYILGSDVDADWESSHELITEVGPRIVPPEEK